MRGRCFTPTDKRYADYGGRGITVCDDWSDFVAFREWALAHGYADDLTIERIDNNNDYSPANCRWATYAEQSVNKRSNRHLTAFGETKTLSEWAVDDRCVVSYNTLFARVTKLGFDGEDALTWTKYRKRELAS